MTQNRQMHIKLESLNNFLGTWALTTDLEIPSPFKVSSKSTIQKPISSELLFGPEINSGHVAYRLATSFLIDGYSDIYLRELFGSWESLLSARLSEEGPSIERYTRASLTTSELEPYINDNSFDADAYDRSNPRREIQVFICLPGSSDFVGNLTELTRRLKEKELPDEVKKKSQHLVEQGFNSNRSPPNWPLGKDGVYFRSGTISNCKDLFAAADSMFELLYDTAAYAHVIRDGRSTAAIDRYHEIAIAMDGNKITAIPRRRFWWEPLSVKTSNQDPARASAYSHLLQKSPTWRGVVNSYFEARRLALDGNYRRSFRALLPALEAAVFPALFVKNKKEFFGKHIREQLYVVAALLALDSIRILKRFHDTKIDHPGARPRKIVLKNILQRIAQSPGVYLKSAHDHYARMLSDTYDARNLLAHGAMNESNRSMITLLFEYYRLLIGIRLQASRAFLQNHDADIAFTHAIRSQFLHFIDLRNCDEWGPNNFENIRDHGCHEWTQWHKAESKPTLEIVPDDLWISKISQARPTVPNKEFAEYCRNLQVFDLSHLL